MNKIITFITNNGLLAIFIIILLEYACFPVSSEVILPFAGAFSRNNDTPYILLLLISIPAGLIGTSLCYLCGYFGGYKLISYITRRFPSTQKSFDYSFQFFDNHGKAAVCVGRIIPLCRTYIAFVAGATKQRYLDFIVYSFIGIALWNSILTGLGFILGSRWEQVKVFYTTYKSIIFPLLIIMLIAFIFKKQIKGFIASRR